MAFAPGLCDLFADPRSILRQKLKAKRLSPKGRGGAFAAAGAGAHREEQMKRICLIRRRSDAVRRAGIRRRHHHHRFYGVADRPAQCRFARPAARLRVLARRGQCRGRHQGRRQELQGEFRQLRRPVGRRPGAAALHPARGPGQSGFPVQPLFVGADRAGDRDFRAVRQGHDRQRRRRGEAVPARQQAPVHGHHLGHPLPLGRGRGAQSEESAKPRSPWSIPTIRSRRRCWRRRPSRPRMPASTS